MESMKTLIDLQPPGWVERFVVDWAPDGHNEKPTLRVDKAVAMEPKRSGQFKFDAAFDTFGTAWSSAPVLPITAGSASTY